MSNKNNKISNGVERILNSETIKYLGKKVKVSGWVNSIRSHGKIVFIDLRDRSGLVQLVCKPEIAEQIRPEWVIEIEGIASERPQKMINPKIETGKVEILVESLKILSRRKPCLFLLIVMAMK